MSATFTRAVRYRVEAVCLTPLRTGGADGAVETVLRDWTGRPFVQGTSLAGALRDWLADRDPDKVESLFGSQQQSGSQNGRKTAAHEDFPFRPGRKARYLLLYLLLNNSIPQKSPAGYRAGGAWEKFPAGESKRSPAHRARMYRGPAVRSQRASSRLPRASTAVQPSR